MAGNLKISPWYLIESFLNFKQCSCSSVPDIEFPYDFIENVGELDSRAVMRSETVLLQANLSYEG